MQLNGKSGDEIFIADGDSATCDALALAFTAEHFSVSTFMEGASLLIAVRERTPAYVMLDTDMPGLSGLDILKKIDARNYRAPVFVVLERGDVPIVVEAIKNGAFDFIVKPLDAENVVTRVREAIETGAGRGALNAVVDSSRKSPGYEKLTGREREVLAQIASGASNKEVGRLLGISPRTVEVYRARVMENLGVRNAAQLVRVVLSA